MTSCIFLRLVPVVNGLGLLLLVDQFPNSRGLDPSKELSFLLGGFLVACVDDGLLMN